MTTSLPEAQQTPVLVQSQTVRLGRSALILGALGLLGAGAGYAIVRLTESVSTPPPAPQRTTAAPVVQTSTVVQTSRAEPQAVAPSVPQHSENPGDDDEDTTAHSGQPSPATVNAGGFYVQVASYKSDSDAKDYAASLTARGLKCESVQDPRSASWHLVRLGPFETRGQAEKARFARCAFEEVSIDPKALSQDANLIRAWLDL